MQELKISDPERFSFKPKQLLAAIAQVYLNLGQEAEFIRSVANDGRSYSKELFERFARVLKNRAIMTDGEIAGIMAFIQRVEDTKATISIEDEREIPDEFLGELARQKVADNTDPLLATRMLSCIGSLTSSHEGPGHPPNVTSNDRQEHYSCCSAVQGTRPVQQHAVCRGSGYADAVD